MNDSREGGIREVATRCNATRVYIDGSKRQTALKASSSAVDFLAKYLPSTCSLVIVQQGGRFTKRIGPSSQSSASSSGSSHALIQPSNSSSPPSAGSSPPPRPLSPQASFSASSPVASPSIPSPAARVRHSSLSGADGAGSPSPGAIPQQWPPPLPANAAPSAQRGQAAQEPSFQFPVSKQKEQQHQQPPPKPPIAPHRRLARLAVEATPSAEASPASSFAESLGGASPNAVAAAALAGIGSYSAQPSPNTPPNLGLPPWAASPGRSNLSTSPPNNTVNPALLSVSHSAGPSPSNSGPFSPVVRSPNAALPPAGPGGTSPTRLGAGLRPVGVPGSPQSLSPNSLSPTGGPGSAGGSLSNFPAMGGGSGSTGDGLQWRQAELEAQQKQLQEMETVLQLWQVQQMQQMQQLLAMQRMLLQQQATVQHQAGLGPGSTGGNTPIPGIPGFVPLPAAPGPAVGLGAAAAPPFPLAPPPVAVATVPAAPVAAQLRVGTVLASPGIRPAAGAAGGVGSGTRAPVLPAPVPGAAAGGRTPGFPAAAGDAAPSPGSGASSPAHPAATFKAPGGPSRFRPQARPGAGPQHALPAGGVGAGAEAGDDLLRQQAAVADLARVEERIREMRANIEAMSVARLAAAAVPTTDGPELSPGAALPTCRSAASRGEDEVTSPVPVRTSSLGRRKEASEAGMFAMTSPSPSPSISPSASSAATAHPAAQQADGGQGTNEELEKFRREYLDKIRSTLKQQQQRVLGGSGSNSPAHHAMGSGNRGVGPSYPEPTLAALGLVGDSGQLQRRPSQERSETEHGNSAELQLPALPLRGQAALLERTSAADSPRRRTGTGSPRQRGGVGSPRLRASDGDSEDEEVARLAADFWGNDSVARMPDPGSIDNFLNSSTGYSPPESPDEAAEQRKVVQGHGGGGASAAVGVARGRQSGPLRGVPEDAEADEGDLLASGEGQDESAPDDSQYLEYAARDLQIATNNFSMDQVLGSGSFGIVYKGWLNGNHVAVKKLRAESKDGMRDFFTEVRVLSNIRHPNIVRLLGHCTEEGCLVYEFLPRGSLQDHLSWRQSDGKFGPLSWKLRFQIAEEMAAAMLFMQRRRPPIVHRDLKPANILLDENLSSKIADLGLARFLSSEFEKASRIVGTVGYIDPAQLRSQFISVKADVYAMGLIILQLLTGIDSIKNLHAVLTDDIGKRKSEAEALILARLDADAGGWPLDLTSVIAGLALRCVSRKVEGRPDLEDEILPKLSSVCRMSAGLPL